MTSNPIPTREARSKILDDPKVGYFVTLLAGLMQLVAELLQVSDQTKAVFIVGAILMGLAVLMWVIRTWPADKTPIYVFASLTILTLIVTGLVPTLIHRKDVTEGTAPPPSPIYYVNVSAYQADGLDDTLNTDLPVTRLPIVVRDQYNRPVTYQTRKDGALVKLSSYGRITIGVCGVFQTHMIPSTSKDKPFTVQIGIDADRLKTCMG